MFNTVKIENFRGFKSFELQNLGRLNLLVGLNNSGKTSILEAIQLLSSPNKPEMLRDLMTSRGEYFRDGRGNQRELDIRHLFYNHHIELGSQFFISAGDGNKSEKLISSIEIHHSQGENEAFSIDEDESLNSVDGSGIFYFILKWIYEEKSKVWGVKLSNNYGLSEKILSDLRSISRKKNEPKTQFITPYSLTSNKMIELFDQVVLTPQEKLLEGALQIIEPKIERIASIKSSESGKGFVVSLSDSKERVPIGSMGDGIWRMLGLVLAIVNAKDGFLFVDEIDTGLHFTTMTDMWRLIWETAKKLNVQVFATTHSYDCWTSLANIVNQENGSKDSITIQRIERDKGISVAFTENEIAIAAERGLEVR